MNIMNAAKAPVLLALFVVLAMVGCKTTMPAAGTPYVEAKDQELQDSTLTIKYVVSVGPGWIVIHNDKGGKPGDVIGYSPVTDGVNSNVMVTIDKKKKTDTLWAMLHTDTGKMGTFEFPGGDPPVMEMEAIVMKSFKATEAMMMKTDEYMQDSGM
jgi:hypothetical protein